ncbi:helix-turn-helix domain-containing protein [Streptomyces sp. EKR5.2]|uniref:helix-turn-helix domain-containing protein n=1 Tax=Streptomyces sp. EKR5.2 TaxID=3461014 RepID=UPI004040F3CC
MSPARWKLARDRRLAGGDEPEELKARRAEIKAKFDLGQAVYDRRTELGLLQTQLAERAGMTQPQISNIEQAGGTPTLPLLRRLAKALDAQLTIDTPRGANRTGPGQVSLGGSLGQRAP